MDQESTQHLFAKIPCSVVRNLMQPRISINHILVYGFLRSHYRNGGPVYPGVDRAKKILGISVRDYWRCIKRLRDLKFIQVKQQKIDDTDIVKNFYYFLEFENISTDYYKDKETVAWLTLEEINIIRNSHCFNTKVKESDKVSPASLKIWLYAKAHGNVLIYSDLKKYKIFEGRRYRLCEYLDRMQRIMGYKDELISIIHNKEKLTPQQFCQYSTNPNKDNTSNDSFVHDEGIVDDARNCHYPCTKLSLPMHETVITDARNCHIKETVLKKPSESNRQKVTVEADASSSKPIYSATYAVQILYEWLIDIGQLAPCTWNSVTKNSLTSKLRVDLRTDEKDLVPMILENETRIKDHIRSLKFKVSPFWFAKRSDDRNYKNNLDLILSTRNRSKPVIRIDPKEDRVEKQKQIELSKTMIAKLRKKD